MTELEQLRAKAAQWTLADDSKLISTISSLVDSMIARGNAFDSKLAVTSTAISRLHSSIDTAESTIGLYSGTQFIEQRVMDDDYRPRRPSAPKPVISLEQRQSIILNDIRTAMKNGLDMIDKSYRRLGDEEDVYIQYEPIDRYNQSIPPVIGSDAFIAMGQRKKKEASIKETISSAVDETANRVEASPLPSSSIQPSPTPSDTRFIGISAFPPAASAPPPPPPDMPTKVSPRPAVDRAALHAQITSALSGGAKGEFRVPHDDGPQDVDAGLTPPLPPRSSLHPAHPAAPPNIPPRGSIQHSTAPELPPKKEEKPSTSIPLPAEPKKKSIFDFDSDDDDFATVLSRPSKTQASSSTLSSSMRSNESDTKSLQSQEERKEPVKNQGPSSLVSELAATAASKRAQQLERAGSSTAPPPLPPRSIDRKEEKPIESPALPKNPLTTSTPAPKIEEKKKEEEVKPVVKKQSWVPPKKSIFDDEDSDIDELFKPASKIAVKKEEIKAEPKKVEEKKEEEKKRVEVPNPVATKPVPEKPKRKNIFDSDSDLEEFLKPKAPAAAQRTPAPKKEEPPKAEEKPEKPLEQSVSNQTKVREEERKEEKKEEKVEEKPAEKTPFTPAVVTTPKPAEEPKPDPITSSPVVRKEEKEEEKTEEKRKETPSVVPTVDPIKPVEEESKEEPLPPREEKAFTPLRESPPPFEEPSTQSTPTSEESVKEEPTPVKEKPIAPARVQKERSVHFDSPPPFVQPEEEPTEEGDQRDSSDTEDSDTEAMQGNRAAFMAQLNAKLAAKPPTGMGVRPVSMIETSSTPFVPPSVDRSSAVPPVTRRAASETKPEGPLSHANKSRPRGPARRPPTAVKKVTSSSDSEDALKSAPRPTVSTSPAVATVPKSTPPRSPIASSPVKESPVVFRKTSDPKSPPASISRKSSSSSLGADADPLSAMSAVHTSPYKASAASKPPTAPMSRMSVSAMSTDKTETKPSSSADSKPKKSIFDSDSDDFYEKFGGAKTLPAKNSAFKNELESALKKDKKAPTSSSSQKKGLFDDSDEDLDMFRKNK